MTETFHRPADLKAEARALRLKQTAEALDASESFVDTPTAEALQANITEQKLASARALSLTTGNGEHIDVTPSRPRMTPELIDAMQQFAVESRVSPENAHDEALAENKKFDTKALRELRKTDYDTYVDTVVALADREIAGELDGRTNQNRLIREHLQTTAEKNIEDTARVAKSLGKSALINSSAIAVGLAKKGWKPINIKLYEVQSTRAHKKHMKTVHKEALAENKLRDHTNRRAARRERLESLRESTLSPARKIGRFALDVHLAGLDSVNPERATEIRRNRDELQAEADRAKTEAALARFDIEGQSDTLQYLMNDETFKPSQVVSSENSEGFLSATFADADETDAKYAFYYAPKGDQLFPYLLKQAKNGAWQRELRGNTVDVHTQTDQDMIVQASNLLDASKSDIARTLDREHIRALRDVLIYSTKRPNENKAYPVSKHAKEREALINAKKTGQHTASKSRKLRDGDEVIHKITSL